MYIKHQMEPVWELEGLHSCRIIMFYGRTDQSY